MSDKDVKAPAVTPQELKLQRQQANLLGRQEELLGAADPLIRARLGLQGEEARLGALTPGERQLEEIRQLQGERLRAALQGDVPVDPALERQLGEQESQLREDLARKLGPDFENTTSGIRALAAFRQRATELRTATGRQEISGGTGLLLGQLGTGAQLGGQRLGALGGASDVGAGLFGRFAQAQQPFQFQRGLEFQASQANQQAGGGLLGGVGQVIGTGLGFGLSGGFGGLFGGKKGGLSGGLGGGGSSGGFGNIAQTLGKGLNVPQLPGGGFFSGG